MNKEENISDYYRNKCLELQQENKQLKEQIIDYSYKLSHFASEETYEKEIKQLQERIDKAIEHLTDEKNIISLFGKVDFRKYDDVSPFEDNSDKIVSCAEIYGYDELLGILKGDNNE